MSTAWNTAPWGSDRESYCHFLINRASMINGCLSPAPPISSQGEQDLDDPIQFQLSMLCAHLPQHSWHQLLAGGAKDQYSHYSFSGCLYSKMEVEGAIWDIRPFTT